METKKFKINKPETTSNGKKSIKRTILSKAGFTLAGGLAGAAIVNGKKPRPEETIVTEEEVPQEIQEQLEESQQQQASENNHPDDISEPQPMDNHHGEDNSGQDATETTDDPRDVAQSIADEIDPNDIDSENVINIDSYDYAYLPDGTQQQVFIGHTPDGTQYILADLDGDGMYGDIFDGDGNYVAEVSGFSISDIAEMVDDTGGYIEGVMEAWESTSSEGGTSPENEELTASEEVDESELDEELLAQLTEDEKEDESSRLIDLEEEDSSDESENEEEIGDDED